MTHFGSDVQWRPGRASPILVRAASRGRSPESSTVLWCRRGFRGRLRPCRAFSFGSSDRARSGSGPVLRIQGRFYCLFSLLSFLLLFEFWAEKYSRPRIFLCIREGTGSCGREMLPFYPVGSLPPHPVRAPGAMPGNRIPPSFRHRRRPR